MLKLIFRIIPCRYFPAFPGSFQKKRIFFRAAYNMGIFFYRHQQHYNHNIIIFRKLQRKGIYLISLAHSSSSTQTPNWAYRAPHPRNQRKIPPGCPLRWRFEKRMRLAECFGAKWSDPQCTKDAHSFLRTLIPTLTNVLFFRQLRLWRCPMRHRERVVLHLF